MKIAIIGAGIVGLSSGVRILESIKNADVTLYADKLPPNTTGDVAAGLFKPYSIDVNDPRIELWCRITYNYLSEFVKTSKDHHKLGIFYQNIYEISNYSQIEKGFYHDIIGNGRDLTASELKKFNNYKYGMVYTTIMSEGNKIIKFMLEKYLKLGGKLKQLNIESIDQVQQFENYNFVINCAGVNSGKLCDDKLTYPIRGQIIIVEAPWLKYGVMNEKFYIFPQSNGNVVLGGTKQKNNWSLAVCDKDTEYIKKGCFELCHSLETCKVMDIKVGLRPGRDRLRLELEKKQNSQTGHHYKIIHNYGHGGSGLTLFWGTAYDVVQLIFNDMKIRSKL